MRTTTWVKTTLASMALVAAQLAFAGTVSATPLDGHKPGGPDEAMRRAVNGNPDGTNGIKTAGDCTWHWFSNRSVCIAVRGEGLHVDTLGAGESWESFRDTGCAVPMLYANGRMFRMGKEVCGRGFINKDFEMNINMPNNTELCLGWTDTSDRACITVHD